MAVEAASLGNGLKSFSIHTADEAERQTFSALAEERASLPAFNAALISLDTVDPETAARRYLDQALASDHVAAFTVPSSDVARSEFKLIGTETVPLTGTRTVKFRQTFNTIPVYGSLVTVELDEENGLVSISSTLGDPDCVSSIARISAADAAAAVKVKPPFKKQLNGISPRLTYYFEAVRAKWRLAFILEDVPVTLPRKHRNKPEQVTPRYFDYVVDALTARVIAELPRTPSMASELRRASDALAVEREIRIETNGAGGILRDDVNNVTTYDFGFGDPDMDDARLPGNFVSSVWPPAAVSAHANAAAVATFLREVVKRNNIDNRGGPMNSSINCVVMSESPDGRQWSNAYWNGRQMVYGQVLSGDSLLTLAAALDIVGHEMFHGVTDNTSRLEYAGQSGALNESYSDIFGTIIANRGESDPRRWEWRLGNGFARNGGPIRDMADPARHGQPAHMRDFRVLPNTRRGDWGGVHINSGIHNKAAHLALISEDASGLIFKPEDVAAIFYLAVTQQLSRTSQFADSRRGAVTAARTLFRRASVVEQSRKISALEQAFEAVGIAA